MGPGLSLDDLVLVVNWEGGWQQWFGFFGRRSAPVLWAYGSAAAFAISLLILSVGLAGWNIRRVWREEPPSARVRWLQDRLFRPVFFQRALRDWLTWQLWRNPIGWLEQRSWSGRLVVWSWFAFVVCVYSSLFANLSLYQRSFHLVQTALAWLLAGGIAMSAAGSFRRERETGVLELLLVAPLRESQIIVGRVRGIWTQFLPAIALLCAVWLYCATFLDNSAAGELVSVLAALVTFATAPVVGLYFSLAKPNFFAALLWTLAVQLLVPAILAQVVEFGWGLAWTPSDGNDFSLLHLLFQGLFQMLLALLLTWRLHADLKARRFALTGKFA